MNNKRGIIVLLVVIALLIVGGGIYWAFKYKGQEPVPVGDGANSTSTASKDSFPSIEFLKNASYLLNDGKLHQFVNGRYDFSFLQGKAGAASPTEGYATLDLDHIVQADLSDTLSVAIISIVVVKENDGGTGTYSLLEVLQGKEAEFITSFDLGDRVTIHSIKAFPPSTNNSRGGWWIAVDMTPWEGGQGVRRTIDLSMSADGQMNIVPRYRNDEYGFYFDYLPAGWSEYSVVTSRWQGYVQQTDGSGPTEFGPEITLKDSRVATTTGDSWQDIPIMVYTIEQWNKDLIVSAAPVPPMELGRNNKYVFALPPRAIGFRDSLGVREVSDWIDSKPLRTFNK